MNENEMQIEINSISEIESTPGFLLPDEKGQFLRDVNRPEYDRLEKKRDEAYRLAANQTPEETPKALPQSNVVPLQEQSELISQAKAEMKLLVDLGFESAEIPLDIPEWKVGSLKMQRLAAEQNYQELTPLINEQFVTLEVPPLEKAAFDAFITGAGNMDETFKEKTFENIIDWIHRANKEKYESDV